MDNQREIVLGDRNEKDNKIKTEDIIDVINGSKKSIDPTADYTAYIKRQLADGLHPSFLEKDEKNFLLSQFGEEWYKDWGYIKEDLDDIVTLKK